MCVRSAKEVKAFNSFKSFEFSTKETINVLKQCEGWLKSQNVAGRTLGAEYQVRYCYNGEYKEVYLFEDELQQKE